MDRAMRKNASMERDAIGKIDGRGYGDATNA
jgi:hypothetical protein